MRIGRIKRPRYYRRQAARQAVALQQIAVGPWRRPRRRWPAVRFVLLVFAMSFAAALAVAKWWELWR